MATKFLLKTIEEYWLSDLATVESFHKELQQDAINQDYQLSGFAYVEKPIKEGKEVIDSYFIVKVTKIFDDSKEPEKLPIDMVIYEHQNSVV